MKLEIESLASLLKGCMLVGVGVGGGAEWLPMANWSVWESETKSWQGCDCWAVLRIPIRLGRFQEQRNDHTVSPSVFWCVGLLSPDPEAHHSSPLPAACKCPGNSIPSAFEWILLLVHPFPQPLWCLLSTSHPSVLVWCSKSCSVFMSVSLPTQHYVFRLNVARFPLSVKCHDFPPRNPLL